MTKVLLVEDEENSRLAIEEFLTSRGFEVLAVSDGESAVTLGHRLAPKVLLCDWLLPGEIGGLEVARTLLEASPDLVVLLMTGLPVADVEREAGDLSVACVLGKPLRLSVIEHAVREALGK